MSKLLLFWDNEISKNAENPIRPRPPESKRIILSFLLFIISSMYKKQIKCDLPGLSCQRSPAKHLFGVAIIVIIIVIPPPSSFTTIQHTKTILPKKEDIYVIIYPS